MKERGILFKAEMVRAILDGSKTQTRRIVKGEAHEWLSDFTPEYVADPANNLCPHGKVGDRLWVRETFCETTNVNSFDNWPDRPHTRTDDYESEVTWSAYIYRADGEWDWCDADGGQTERSFWKPSLFMPRIASRITLEITDVRIERLKDIGNADSIAEGISRFYDNKHYSEKGVGAYRYHDYITGVNDLTDPVRSYRSLWESINGPASWNANPWVWVIEFKMLELNG